MTIRETIAIHCNGFKPAAKLGKLKTPEKRCAAAFSHSGDNVSSYDVRRDAEDAGWVRDVKGDRDFCPEHASQAPQVEPEGWAL